MEEVVVAGGAVAAAEAEVRRAQQYGVRPDELAREITETQTQLKASADGAQTTHSR